MARPHPGAPEESQRAAAFAGALDGAYAAARRRRSVLRYRYRVRALAAHTAFRRRWPGSAPPRVVDLGAADGLPLLYLHALEGGRGDFLGIEIAADLIYSAPPLPVNVRLVQGDLMDLDLPEPGQWDLCTALALLEHLPCPRTAVAAAFALLRPGGVFVASAPHPFWDQAAGKLGLLRAEAHQHAVSAFLLQELARETGFCSIDVQPFMWVASGALSYLGLSLSPARSLQLDARLWRLRLPRWSFVNQLLVASRPAY